MHKLGAFGADLGPRFPARPRACILVVMDAVGEPDRAGAAPTEEAAGAPRSAARFGWCSLATWACGGLGLEILLALKVPAYVDDELTRALLRLAHAHGVGLSIVVIAFGASAAVRLDPSLARHVLRAIATGAVAIPLGFALGAVAHPEGDPSPGIFLVPVGALALLYGLLRTARGLWR